MEFLIGNKIALRYKLTVFVIVTVLGIASCQTTDSNHKIKEADAVLHLIIHGKVDSIRSHKYNKAVVIMPHAYPCSDSTGNSDAVPRHQAGGHIEKKSGTYRFPLTTPVTRIPRKKEGKDLCFTAKVVSYHDSDDEYDRVLAGPKKFGKEFLTHFREKPPFDSVRVDFTVHDSTKRAADDATMK